MAANRKMTEKQVEQACKMYDEWKRLDDICQHFPHVSPSTVKRNIRKNRPARSKAGPDRLTCECGANVYRARQCRQHYRERLAKQKGKCNLEGCDSLQKAKGVCSKHYQRIANGLPLRKQTAVWVNSGGYVCEYIPDHPQANSDGRVLQHRRVVSDSIGRRLESWETVHHINGDKTDNRLENLELWSRMQPAGQRVTDLIDYAKEILERYGDLYG